MILNLIFVFLLVPYGNENTFNTHKKWARGVYIWGKKPSRTSENCLLKQIGKWVWVNAKQFWGILKCRAARLKWEQTRKKLARRNKMSNKPLLQGGSNNMTKENNDYALYSPTSTPLTWSPDLYVQELLNSKRILEVLGVKEHERDCKI
jgi:hypothetical protein